MVNIAHKPFFPATKPFQQAFALACAFLLQAGYDALIEFSNSVNLAARFHVTVRCRSNAFNTKICSYWFFAFFLRFGYIDNKMEIKGFISAFVNQHTSFWLLTFKQT